MPRPNADTGQPALPDFASTRALPRFLLRAGARKLTPQPLPENAVCHGIEPRFSGGAIKIGMRSGGETLQLDEAAARRTFEPGDRHRVKPGLAVEQE